jgi:predicted metal-dependent hydrolase
VDLARYREGIELFNRREFFECHEVLEDVWNQLKGEERVFVQAMIQVAVGFVHWTRGNPIGAQSLWRRALLKLERFDGLYLHIDVASLCESVRLFASHPNTAFPEIRFIHTETRRPQGRQQ